MADFSFNCVSCGATTFTVNAASIGSATPVATFICPKCGAYNAVQERPGGGLVVAIDKHATSGAQTPATNG